MRRSSYALLSASVLLAACGGGDKSTGPAPLGPPILTMVNGVSAPSGLVGQTILLEGTTLGDSARGAVYFLGTGGTKVRAAAANADWSGTFIVATVPSGIADSSQVWVETTGGVSDSLPFTLAAGATFSPSNITWTSGTALPVALTGLGAGYVTTHPSTGTTNNVFVVGGQAAGAPVATLYRAAIGANNAPGAWETVGTGLRTARAFHATAAATRSTAPLDTNTAAVLYAIGGRTSDTTVLNSVERARVRRDGTVDAFATDRALPAPLASASAVVFRGYLYVAGGATTGNVPVATVYRARIGTDGALGIWETMPALPKATAYGSLTNLGPYLYYVGGDTAAVLPAASTPSGTETGAVYLARVDIRSGAIPAWSTLTALGKARSKHGAVVAGAALLATSGLYSGQAGSSENTYATINSDGTITSWGGATGSNTIAVVLGYSLLDQATITFVDATGAGHVMVLGGTKRTTTGGESAAVVYY